MFRTTMDIAGFDPELAKAIASERRRQEGRLLGAVVLAGVGQRLAAPEAGQHLERGLEPSPAAPKPRPV